MAVKHYGEVYLCKICGNKVEVIEAGGGTLVCCDKEMQLTEDENRTAAALPDSGG